MIKFESYNEGTLLINTQDIQFVEGYVGYKE
jgi:hypothetical protein